LGQRKKSLGHISVTDSFFNYCFQMINIFVKQTTSVESQRIVQLVGRADESDFEQGAKKLHKLFFTETENLENSSFCLKQIEVSIESASNLPSTDVLGSVDPFCNISCGGTVHETVVKKRNNNPQWNQNFLFKVSNEESDLVIKVLDWDRFKSNEVVGTVKLSGQEIKSIFNESEWHDKSVQLTRNGELVADANGNPSIIKFRLKNAGLDVSGCELSELRKFCLAFDTNNDGQVSENEFIEMMKQISVTTLLFTGSESGDSLLESLSSEQMQALLKHKWIIPGNETRNPLESIIDNIHNQYSMQTLQREEAAHDAMRVSRNDESLRVGENRILAPEEAIQGPMTTGDAKHEIVSEAWVGINDQIKTVSSDTTKQNVLDRAKPMEEYLNELKVLAKTLRGHKVIVLPSLSWGSESNDKSNQDSREEIAIR
jgi:hypothetical protein